MRNFIGIPFARNGNDPKVGLNCWSLVMHVGRHFGIDIPDFHVDDSRERTIFRAYLMEREKPCWTEIERPEKACIVALAIREHDPATIQHFGIGIDKYRFIHTTRKTGSILSRYDGLLWKNRIRGFYRWTG